jgi:putative Mg2+ transporter-C (MgtC) family protein
MMLAFLAAGIAAPPGERRVLNRRNIRNMDPISQATLLSIPDLQALGRVSVRLIAALLLGALIGYQRERSGKAAGLRTHMLVALGTALFVVSAVGYGMGEDALSRVIQVLATGIGFLGAGAILKIHEDKEIRGLTTAAGVWMTAAASVAIGLGQIVLGLIGGVLAWIVLAVLDRFEPKVKSGPSHGNG